MTDEIAKTSEADASAMPSIADAMRDAAATASDHASHVKQAASEAGRYRKGRPAPKETETWRRRRSPHPFAAIDRGSLGREAELPPRS